MCFIITSNTEKCTKRARARKKDITAYKVVNIRNEKYVSFYIGYEWKKGLNKSSRRWKDITKEEKRQWDINNGFHFLRTKKIVLNDYGYDIHHRKGVVIIACSIKPEDVVAVNDREIVAIKSTLIKEVKI